MRIAIAAPVAAGSTKGNGTTARRWHVLLTKLGHEVDCYGPDEVVAAGADILIALHARKSAAAVRAFRQAFPRRPLVVALTGTDLNLDLPDDPDARASVAAADRLVVLYVGAEALLEPEFREKAVPILQSATATSGVAKAAPFQVCVLAHLREVKAPLCVARAAARLPAGSPIRVVLAGSAYDDQHRDAARAAAAATPGFVWREECSTADAARLLAESHVMVISSRAEGGANVVMTRK